MKDIFFTVNEAAQHLGVSRITIYSAIARKRLPRRYRAGSLGFTERGLQAWQQNKSAGGWPRGRSPSQEHRAAISVAKKKGDTRPGL